MTGLLQIGTFPPEVQTQIDAEFRCLRIEDLERDPSLAASCRERV